MTEPTAREGEGTWARLRRRKVVEWGIAYVAGAWGLLEGTGFVADAFAWPAATKQIATLVLLIGFPIVLVLAWYHGDRGEQRMRGPELAIITLLFLAGGGLFWWYDRSTEALTETNEAAPAQVAASADARPSIAVLPFENRSDEHTDAYFVDGIHDDILTQLTKIGAMKVIARTSVEQFRDTRLPIKAIAEQLGVTKILEGGVQRAGDRVRITVQLIDTATDAHLWAENYDRELTAENIFAIQSEVASAIAVSLKASLTRTERASINSIPTGNLEAWESYQRGQQRMALRKTASLIEAERLFRRAADLDPRFALAWVGLADALRLQAMYGSRPQDTALADADKSVARAIELDPHLAEAWASAGGIADQQMQFERAEVLLRRAIALNPNYATAHHWLSAVLAELGRSEEGLEAAERAAQLDPLSAIINSRLGVARMDVGLFDEALVAFGRAIKIDPNMALAHACIGEVHAFGFGRLDIAVPWFKRASSMDPEDSLTLALMTQALWELGEEAEAVRWLDRIRALGDLPAYSRSIVALLDLERGESDSARLHAQSAAALDPSHLFLLSNLDIQMNDYATARDRYAKSFPGLLDAELTALSASEAAAAIDLARVLQKTGEGARARELLDRAEAYFRTIPRMGINGYGVAVVSIHALRGEKAMALEKLRDVEQSGWRGGWKGRHYYRDIDPNLDSIRNEPEFKAVFADIELDMARQRAALAARPKDAPLELKRTGT